MCFFIAETWQLNRKQCAMRARDILVYRENDQGDWMRCQMMKGSMSLLWRRNMIFAASVESIVLEFLVITWPKPDQTLSEGAEVGSTQRKRRASLARRRNCFSSWRHYAAGWDSASLHSRNRAPWRGSNQFTASETIDWSFSSCFLYSGLWYPSISIAMGPASRTNAEKDRIVAEYRAAKSARISHPLTNIARQYSLDPPQLRKWEKNSAQYSAFPHISTVPTVVREGIFPEMEKALNEQVFRVLICSSCTSLVVSLGMLRFWPSDIAVLLFHVIALVVWLCQCWNPIVMIDRLVNVLLSIFVDFASLPCLLRFLLTRDLLSQVLVDGFIDFWRGTILLCGS